MPFFTPLSNVLFILMIVSGLFWAYMEVVQLFRRRKTRKNLIHAVFNQWLEICCERITRSETHPYEDHRHPHQQWFIHREASVFERYLNLKGNRSQSEANYLAECKSKMRRGIFYKPED